MYDWIGFWVWQMSLACLHNCDSVCLSFGFDTIHRAGVGTQFAYVFSRLLARGENYTDMNDAIPVPVLDPIEVMSEPSKVLICTVCQTCDNTEQPPGNMMPEISAYVQEKDLKMGYPPTLAEQLAAQYQTPTFHQYAAPAGRLEAKLDIDSNGRLVKQYTIDCSI